MRGGRRLVVGRGGREAAERRRRVAGARPARGAAARGRPGPRSPVARLQARGLVVNRRNARENAKTSPHS